MGQESTLPELLGARVRLCIEKAGYRTVEEFAFAFGIGKSTLSEVLSGKKSPTVSTLARWANALEISLTDFFDDERIHTWIREASPEYFHNRAKTPRASKVPKAPKQSKTPKAIKASRKTKASSKRK
jgi:transcriptional regulator with XRE-family HTH domain